MESVVNNDTQQREAGRKDEQVDEVPKIFDGSFPAIFRPHVLDDEVEKILQERRLQSHLRNISATCEKQDPIPPETSNIDEKVSKRAVQTQRIIRPHSSPARLNKTGPLPKARISSAQHIKPPSLIQHHHCASNGITATSIRTWRNPEKTLPDGTHLSRPKTTASTSKKKASVETMLSTNITSLLGDKQALSYSQNDVPDIIPTMLDKRLKMLKEKKACTVVTKTPNDFNIEILDSTLLENYAVKIDKVDIPIIDCLDMTWDRRTPEEWLAIGRNSGLPGTLAKCRYNDLTAGTCWRQCYVINYDHSSNEYLIEWSEKQSNETARKSVARHVLRFEIENESEFQRWVSHAYRLKYETEQQIRYEKWITKIDDGDKIYESYRASFPCARLSKKSLSLSTMRRSFSSKMPDEIKDKIKQKMSFCGKIPAENVLEECMNEVEQLYVHSMKRAWCDYHLTDKFSTQVTNNANERKKAQEFTDALCSAASFEGGHEDPDIKIDAVQRLLTTKMFMAHELIQDTFLKIIGDLAILLKLNCRRKTTWQSPYEKEHMIFAGNKLSSEVSDGNSIGFFLKNYTFPCQFSRFVEGMNLHGQVVQQKLIHQWPSRIVRLIEENLNDFFNLDVLRKQIILEEVSSFMQELNASQNTRPVESAVENYGRCRDFLRLITLVMEEQLHGVIRAGFKQFLYTFGLREKSSSCDNFEILLPDRYPVLFSLVLGVEHGNDKDAVITEQPLVGIAKNAGFVRSDNQIVIKPALDKVELDLDNIFHLPLSLLDQKVSHVGSLLFQSQKEFDLVSNPMKDTPKFSKHSATFLRPFSKDDEVFLQGKIFLAQLFQRTRRQIGEVLEKFTKYNFLLTEYPLRAEELKQNSLPINWFKDTLHRFKIAKYEIEALPDEAVIVPPFEVQTALIKKLLKDQASQNVEILEKYLLKHLNSLVFQLFRIVISKKETLKIIPKTAGEWEMLSKEIDVCDDIAGFDQELHHLRQLWEITTSLSVAVEDSISSQYWEVFGWPSNREILIQIARYNLANLKTQLLDQIYVDKKFVLDSISAYNEEFEVLKSCKDIKSTSERVCNHMNSLYDRFQKILYISEEVAVKEVVLGEKKSDFSLLTLFKEEFLPLKDLWTLGHTYYTSLKNWKDSAFGEIDIEEIEKLYRIWKNDLWVFRDKFSKKNSGRELVMELITEVDDFGRHLVSVASLRSPNLRDRHWEQISAVLGVMPGQLMDMKFREVLNLDMSMVLHLISDINARASAENRIEADLAIIQSELASIQLKLEHFYNGAYSTICNRKELTTVLESLLSRVQQLNELAGAQHLADTISVLKERLIHTQENIATLTSVMDEYLLWVPLFTNVNKDTTNLSYAAMSISSEVELLIGREKYEELRKLVKFTLLATSLVEKLSSLKDFVNSIDSFKFLVTSRQLLNMIAPSLQKLLYDQCHQYPEILNCDQRELLKAISKFSLLKVQFCNTSQIPRVGEEIIMVHEFRCALPAINTITIQVKEVKAKLTDGRENRGQELSVQSVIVKAITCAEGYDYVFDRPVSFNVSFGIFAKEINYAVENCIKSLVREYYLFFKQNDRELLKTCVPSRFAELGAACALCEAFLRTTSLEKFLEDCDSCLRLCGFLKEYENIRSYAEYLVKCRKFSKEPVMILMKNLDSMDIAIQYNEVEASYRFKYSSTGIDTKFILSNIPIVKRLVLMHSMLQRKFSIPISHLAGIKSALTLFGGDSTAIISKLSTDVTELNSIEQVLRTTRYIFTSSASTNLFDCFRSHKCDQSFIFELATWNQKSDCRSKYQFSAYCSDNLYRSLLLPQLNPIIFDQIGSKNSDHLEFCFDLLDDIINYSSPIVIAGPPRSGKSFCIDKVSSIYQLFTKSRVNYVFTQLSLLHELYTNDRTSLSKTKQFLEQICYGDFDETWLVVDAKLKSRDFKLLDLLSNISALMHYRCKYLIIDRNSFFHLYPRYLDYQTTFCLQWLQRSEQFIAKYPPYSASYIFLKLFGEFCEGKIINKRNSNLQLSTFVIDRFFHHLSDILNSSDVQHHTDYERKQGLLSASIFAMYWTTQTFLPNRFEFSFVQDLIKHLEQNIQNGSDLIEESSLFQINLPQNLDDYYFDIVSLRWYPFESLISDATEEKLNIDEPFLFMQYYWLRQARSVQKPLMIIGANTSYNYSNVQKICRCHSAVPLEKFTSKDGVSVVYEDASVTAHTRLQSYRKIKESNCFCIVLVDKLEHLRDIYDLVYDWTIVTVEKTFDVASLKKDYHNLIRSICSDNYQKQCYRFQYQERVFEETLEKTMLQEKMSKEMVAEIAFNFLKKFVEPFHFQKLRLLVENQSEISNAYYHDIVCSDLRDEETYIKESISESSHVCIESWLAHWSTNLITSGPFHLVLKCIKEACKKRDIHVIEVNPQLSWGSLSEIIWKNILSDKVRVVIVMSENTENFIDIWKYLQCNIHSYFSLKLKEKERVLAERLRCIINFEKGCSERLFWVSKSLRLFSDIEMVPEYGKKECLLNRNVVNILNKYTSDVQIKLVSLVQEAADSWTDNLKMSAKNSCNQALEMNDIVQELGHKISNHEETVEELANELSAIDLKLSEILTLIDSKQVDIEKLKTAQKKWLEERDLIQRKHDINQRNENTLAANHEVLYVAYQKCLNYVLKSDPADFLKVTSESVEISILAQTFSIVRDQELSPSSALNELRGICKNNTEFYNVIKNLRPNNFVPHRSQRLSQILADFVEFSPKNLSKYSKFTGVMCAWIHSFNALSINCSALAKINSETLDYKTKLQNLEKEADQVHQLICSTDELIKRLKKDFDTTAEAKAEYHKRILQRDNDPFSDKEFCDIIRHLDNKIKRHHEELEYELQNAHDDVISTIIWALRHLGDDDVTMDMSKKFQPHKTLRKILSGSLSKINLDDSFSMEISCLLSLLYSGQVYFSCNHDYLASSSITCHLVLGANDENNSNDSPYTHVRLIPREKILRYQSSQKTSIMLCCTPTRDNTIVNKPFVFLRKPKDVLLLEIKTIFENGLLKTTFRDYSSNLKLQRATQNSLELNENQLLENLKRLSREKDRNTLNIVKQTKDTYKAITIAEQAIERIEQKLQDEEKASENLRSLSLRVLDAYQLTFFHDEKRSEINLIDSLKVIVEKTEVEMDPNQIETATKRIWSNFVERLSSQLTAPERCIWLLKLKNVHHFTDYDELVVNAVQDSDIDRLISPSWLSDKNWRRFLIFCKQQPRLSNLPHEILKVSIKQFQNESISWEELYTSSNPQLLRFPAKWNDLDTVTKINILHTFRYETLARTVPCFVGASFPATLASDVWRPDVNFKTSTVVVLVNWLKVDPFPFVNALAYNLQKSIRKLGRNDLDNIETVLDKDVEWLYIQELSSVQLAMVIKHIETGDFSKELRIWIRWNERFFPWYFNVAKISHIYPSSPIELESSVSMLSPLLDYSFNTTKQLVEDVWIKHALAIVIADILIQQRWILHRRTTRSSVDVVEAFNILNHCSKKSFIDLLQHLDNAQSYWEHVEYVLLLRIFSEDDTVKHLSSQLEMKRLSSMMDKLTLSEKFSILRDKRCLEILDMFKLPFDARRMYDMGLTTQLRECTILPYQIERSHNIFPFLEKAGNKAKSELQFFEKLWDALLDIYNQLDTSVKPIPRHFFKNCNNYKKLVRRCLDDIRAVSEMASPFEKHWEPHLLFLAIDLLMGKPFRSWWHLLYPTAHDFDGLKMDLYRRVVYCKELLSMPKLIDLSKLFDPEGFFNAALEEHSSKKNLPIESLDFLLVPYIELPQTSNDTFLVHGINISGALWDSRIQGFRDRKDFSDKNKVAYYGISVVQTVPEKILSSWYVGKKISEPPEEDTASCSNKFRDSKGQSRRLYRCPLFITRCQVYGSCESIMEFGDENYNKKRDMRFISDAYHPLIGSFEQWICALGTSFYEYANMEAPVDIAPGFIGTPTEEQINVFWDAVNYKPTYLSFNRRFIGSFWMNPGDLSVEECFLRNICLECESVEDLYSNRY